MHADACFIDAGKRSELPGPEARMDFFFCFDVSGTHGHDLGAERKNIPVLRQGQNITADQFSLVFSHFDKMGLNGKAVIPASVFPRQRSAVKIDDPVFFTTLIIQVPGRNDAHITTPPNMFCIR